MKLPSKELLSKVLGVYVTEFYLDCESLVYTYDRIFNENEQYKDDINIYELAHKCKEWAVNLKPNKHALSSYPRWNNIRDYPETNGNYYICQHLVSGIQFEAATEPEAIFKACEWILENKDN